MHTLILETFDLNIIILHPYSKKVVPRNKLIQTIFKEKFYDWFIGKIDPYYSMINATFIEYINTYNEALESELLI